VTDKQRGKDMEVFNKVRRNLNLLRGELTGRNPDELPKRRCKYRAKRIAWCLKLKKFCNAPLEYERCPYYKPR
jgi:hypothetical protein